MNVTQDTFDMASLETQVLLADNSAEDVSISISRNKTIDKSVSLSSDIKDKLGRLQVGYMKSAGSKDSKLYVTVSIPNSMKNSLISKVKLQLYQNFSECAETGTPMDLYQVNSFGAADLVFGDENRVATVYTNTDTGSYRSFDITNAVKGIYGKNIYFVLKMRKTNTPVTTNSSCCGGCCEGDCAANNATFFSKGNISITCTGQPLSSGVYKLSNCSNGRHIYAADNWIENGDIVKNCAGKSLTPFAELCHMWRIRALTNGLYAIYSVLNPDVALSVQTVGGIKRVVAMEIGQCNAEVPENAQWLIIPYDGYWILYNDFAKQVIRTNGSMASSSESLEIVEYTDESCVKCQHWSIGAVSDSPIGNDVLMYSDMLGWIESGENRIALPVGATTRLHAVRFPSNYTCHSGWTSSNSSIATVSSTGVITAKKAGTVTISATINCKFFKFNITVVDGDIAIVKYSDHAKVNGTIQLKAVTAVSGKTITWNSGDKNKATVDQKGLVTVKSIDAFEITASASGLQTQTMTLYGVLDDGVYKFKNGNRYISVSESTLFTDSEVQTTESADTVDQYWHICYQSDGQYVIRSYANPRMVLGFNDEYPDNVYILKIPTNSTISNAAYKWTISKDDNGFVLRNGKTRKSLNIDGSVVGTVSYSADSSAPHWGMTSVTNVSEELVVYDLAKKRYLNDYNDICDLYLSPAEFRELSAIYRSPDDVRQSFKWYSDDTSIAIANTVGGITACDDVDGDIKYVDINVEAKNHSSVSKTISVCVRIPIDSVSLTHCITMVAGHTRTIYPTIYPSKAVPISVAWKSDKTGVASVSKGEIEARNEGTTVITVVVFDGTMHTAQCTLTVKPKEDVRIEKDGEYFKVTFVEKEDDGFGKVWKSVEYDLSPDAYKYSMTIPETARERSNYNNEYEYSTEQLALLYLFDPLGVEYYIRTYGNNHGKTGVDLLFFKDEVFNAIYGRMPFRIYKRDDNTIYKSNYKASEMTDYVRERIYTEAEILFGAHQKPIDAFDVAEFIHSIVLAIFESVPIIPSIVDYIETCVDIHKMLFHSGAVVNNLNNRAAEYLSDFVDEALDEALPSASDLVLRYLPASWPHNLFEKAADAFDKAVDIIGQLTGLAWDAVKDQFTPFTSYDVQIYDRVQENSKYNCIFRVKGESVSIEQFIESCK